MVAPKSKEEISILDIKAYLVGKCILDQNFMELFLKNPKKILEEELKINLPDTLEIKVVKDNDNLIHVVLPLVRDVQEGSEISDEYINTLAKKGDFQLNIPTLKIFLILKSIKYPSFKKDLLGDPKGILKKELKCPVPDQMEIRILEDTEKLFYVTLPSEQIMQSAKEKLNELSDEELKEITGGYSAKAFGADLLRVLSIGKELVVSGGSGEKLKEIADHIVNVPWGQG